MSQALEDLNRRAFMFGAMLTYAGWFVPKPRMIAVPAQIGTFPQWELVHPIPTISLSDLGLMPKVIKGGGVIFVPAEPPGIL